jgi:hypothetical protein
MRIRKCDLPLKTKILEITPNSFTHSAKLKGDQVELQTSFRSNEKYARRLWFAFEPLWWVLHFLDWLVLDRFIPSFSFGFLTLSTKYSTPGSTISGIVYNQTELSFADKIASAGTANIDNPELEGMQVGIDTTTTADMFNLLCRAYFLFDTSALGATATVTGATIGLWGDLVRSQLGGSPELDIVSSTPASDTALENTDFVNIGSTPFSSVAWADTAPTAYISFNLNASGIANVSLTGKSKFGARLNWDTDGSFGGTWASAKETMTYLTGGGYTGTSRDPKIDITYTLPATGNFLFMF